MVLPIRDALTPIDDLTGLIDDTDIPLVGGAWPVGGLRLGCRIGAAVTACSPRRAEPIRAAGCPSARRLITVTGQWPCARSCRIWRRTSAYRIVSQ
ncbi:MAG: hypothetical protein ACRDTT_15540, partial [Pseudonocardiaceae bacterium]